MPESPEGVLYRQRAEAAHCLGEVLQALNDAGFRLDDAALEQRAFDIVLAHAPEALPDE